MEAKSITFDEKSEPYKVSNARNKNESTNLPSRRQISESLIFLSKNISVTDEKSFNLRAQDCQELFNMGYNVSGIYTVHLQSRLVGFNPVKVYCDMDTDGGGWTVIQRRGDFQRPIRYFHKTWKEYKIGFGNLQKDFWLGNDIIFSLTNQELYSVRFDLKDFDGNSLYAVYDEFWIDDEHKNYTLHIKDYSGDAGDSMSKHNNIKFSTEYRRNEGIQCRWCNCPKRLLGGWWYCCYGNNLNGIYQKPGEENELDGISWYRWKGYPLSSTEIKIRPQITILRSV